MARVTVLGILGVLLITVGCAAGSPTARDSEALRYRRADNQIKTVEQFERLHRRCRAAGGHVVMHRTSSGRMPPTALELKSASCAKRASISIRF